MSSTQGEVRVSNRGRLLLVDATAGSVTGRGLIRTLALAVVLAVVGGVSADPPLARAYDYDYYIWCQDAIGSAEYCCSQAGGVLNGSSCAATIPSAAPSYLPPNNGFLIP